MPAVSEQVLQAVLNVIRGLTLNPAPVGVRPRKSLKLSDGELATPGTGFVFVAQGDGEKMELMAGGYPGGQVMWLVTYPVSVATAFRNQGAQADNPTARNWWDLIWPAVTDIRQLVSAGLAQGNTSWPGGKTQFDPVAVDKAVDWGVKTFMVETTEIR